MSSQVYDVSEDEKESTIDDVDNVSDKINDIYVESQSTIERIRDLQETVGNLKSELQGTVFKIKQNVDIFKGIITNKISLILNLLTKKQEHIQNTLQNCYMIIDNLVETFLNIGYELEKDINVISLKINDFDSEIRKMKDGQSIQNGTENTTLWFINSEGRLTKQKNIVLSSALPRFNCGSRKIRRSFIYYLEDAFKAYQVPNNLWVPLASTQFRGMAIDWWNMHDKSISWEQFTKYLIEWGFNDNIIRRKILSLQKHIAETGKLSEMEISHPEIDERGFVSCNQQDSCKTCKDVQNNNNERQQQVLYKPLSTHTVTDCCPKSSNSENTYLVLEKSLQEANYFNTDFNEDDSIFVKTSSNSFIESTAKNSNLKSFSCKRKLELENTSHSIKYKLRKRKK